MKLKTLLLSLLIFVIQFRAYGQNSFDSKGISDSIISICNKIAEDGIIKSNFTGKSMTISEQWKRFENLTALASDQVLFQLTTHVDPTVRGYAFWGLINRKSDLLISALRKNENDTIRVEYFKGCMKYSVILIDLIVIKTNQHKFKNWNSRDRKYFKQLYKRTRQRTPNNIT